MEPFTMMALGGAALGALQGDAQRRQNERMNLAQAEMTRYSPWTGMRGQIQANNASALGGAAQGGLSGAMFGQQFAGKFGGGGGGADLTIPQDGGMANAGLDNSVLQNQMQKQSPYMYMNNQNKMMG